MITAATRYRLGKQNTFILHDTHIDSLSERITPSHAHMILTMAQELNAYCIVEDMFDYHGSDAEIQKIAPLMLDNIAQGRAVLFSGMDLIHDTVLCTIAQKLRAANIRVSNSEFRHDWLVNQWYGARGFPHDALAAFHKLLQSFKIVIEEIQQYQDDPRLQSYYDQVIQKATKAHTHLAACAGTVLPSAAATALFLNSLWECMVLLLDARLVHEWYQKTQSEEQIIICVGAEHAVALERICLLLGYEEVTSLGDTSLADYVRTYRTAIHNYQLEPATIAPSFVKNIKNSWRTFKQIRLNTDAAKRYKEAIVQTKKVAFHEIVKGNV
jgi:hypothetical protein